MLVKSCCSLPLLIRTTVVVKATAKKPSEMNKRKRFLKLFDCSRLVFGINIRTDWGYHTRGRSVCRMARWSLSLFLFVFDPYSVVRVLYMSYTNNCNSFVSSLIVPVIHTQRTRYHIVLLRQWLYMKGKILIILMRTLS